MSLQNGCRNAIRQKEVLRRMSYLHVGQAVLLGLPLQPEEKRRRNHEHGQEKISENAGIFLHPGIRRIGRIGNHTIWQKGLENSPQWEDKEALIAKRWAMVVEHASSRPKEDVKEGRFCMHESHMWPDFRNPDGSSTKRMKSSGSGRLLRRAFPGQDNST